MYKDIFLKLSTAKESGQSEKIKEALSSLCDFIDNAVKISLKTSTFAEFVIDEQIMFKTNRNILSKNIADINIKSTGLVSQLLDMVGVSEYENIANGLSDSIDDIHSLLSSGKEVSEAVIDEVLNASRVLRMAI